MNLGLENEEENKEQDDNASLGSQYYLNADGSTDENKAPEKIIFNNIKCIETIGQVNCLCLEIPLKSLENGEDG